MALNLLNSFGKQGVSYGLSTIVADVNDTAYLSKYFVVSEFNPKFTAGRNAFSLNGSTFLLPGSEIFIECIDSAGSNLFVEMATTIDVTAKSYAYKEGTSYILSIHVYNDTADGVGKLICFGTLTDNRTVKWQQNITIDKTLNNVSKVRFYNRPILEADPVLVPLLGNDSPRGQSITFGGKAHTNAINPAKDVNYPSVNKRNIDIDYRLTVDVPPIVGNIPDDRNGLNSQMIGAIANLNINKIKAPFSNNLIVPTQKTASIIISDVVTNNTLKLIDSYYYADHNNNQIVTDIDDADFSITYPYIAYNTVTASYQTSNINGTLYIIQDSYADVVYRNIRTFTGFVARHKLYRRSLLSSGDFSIIADEPLSINEQLKDNLTLNKFYERMGKFYSDEHIQHYWFTSSNNLSVVHTPQFSIDSCLVDSPNSSNLNGTDYIIVKNDSINTDRDAIYTPFNQSEFNRTSGSGYDSNFIALKSNVQYILQSDSIIIKDNNVTDAYLEFYFTSSVAEAKNDPNYNVNHGIKLARLNANVAGNLNNFYDQIFFYTPKNDLYGTIVIVPFKCKAYLKNISFRVYGDDGFSPDLFITRIPWPVSIPNETYQIKAELFDINHNLVYSDLNTVQNFDSSGSSLIPFIPGNGIIQPGTEDVVVSGSLYVSKSVVIDKGDLFLNNGDIVLTLGNLYVPSMTLRPNLEISHSRLITRIDDSSPSGKLDYTPIVDVGVNSEHIYVLTGSSVNNDVLRGQSISAVYARKIYWDNLGNKQVETI